MESPKHGMDTAIGRHFRAVVITIGLKGEMIKYISLLNRDVNFLLYPKNIVAACFAASTSADSSGSAIKSTVGSTVGFNMRLNPAIFSRWRANSDFAFCAFSTSGVSLWASIKFAV